MTNDWNGVVTYARENPLIHGHDWNGWCEAFVSDAGEYPNSFGNATAARKASKVYGPHELALASVPTGWLLWWDYNPDGHVGFAAPGGLALMASSFVQKSIHRHLGYVKRGDYQHLSGHVYLGASPDHGGQYLKGILRTPPAVATYYTVVSGDTLSAIAAAHHITLPALELLNPLISDPDSIYPGQKVRIK